MSRRQPNKIRLNDLIIKRLKPQDRPYLIWDTKQRNLAIQVQPSGFASYKCIYSRHGRPRWYSIEHVDAIGLQEARKLAATRFAFYDHMKNASAAPPDILEINDKHLTLYPIANCVGIIMTTNYKTDGVYPESRHRSATLPNDPVSFGTFPAWHGCRYRLMSPQRFHHRDIAKHRIAAALAD
jgi:hypothetical protein